MLSCDGCHCTHTRRFSNYYNNRTTSPSGGIPLQGLLQHARLQICIDFVSFAQSIDFTY